MTAERVSPHRERRERCSTRIIVMNSSTENRYLLLPGVAVALLLAAAAWQDAHAQAYPSRPIRLVLGFPSGGTPDALARSVANQVEAQLGRSIVVDNRTGANGIIAAEIVATAPADGYTMLFSPPALVINQIVQKKAPYDVLRDFVPISL